MTLANIALVILILICLGVIVYLYQSHKASNLGQLGSFYDESIEDRNNILNRTILDQERIIAGLEKDLREIRQEVEEQRVTIHSLRARVLSFPDVMRQLKVIGTSLFRDTGAQRFLILTARKGLYEEKYCSAIYEDHDSDSDSSQLSRGAVEKYNYLRIDEHYLNMLKHIEVNGYILLTTDKMEPCLLKEIYKTEKVVQSLVFRIHVFNKKGYKKIRYASIATHREEGFSNYDANKLHSYTVQIVKALKPVLVDVDERVVD